MDKCRIAQAFPSLKLLSMLNLSLQQSDPAKLEYNNNQSFPIAEHPHLNLLDMMRVHFNYVEQLLHESKTRLPCLTRLYVNYD
jgi:hypothetical protein